jgi:hypothetical protein
MPFSQPQTADLYQNIFDFFPEPLIIITQEGLVVRTNLATQKVFYPESTKVLNRPGGDVLGCVYAGLNGETCGYTEYCTECVIRNSLTQVVNEDKVIKQQGKFKKFDTEGNTINMDIFVIAVKITFEQKLHVLIAIDDLTELFSLRKIIPICANCKKIRDDDQYWHNVETYLAKYMQLSFTHGLCPTCIEILYPNLPK